MISIFVWNPSVMPLLFLKRHMATIGSRHKVSVFAKLCGGLALSCSVNARNLGDARFARLRVKVLSSKKWFSCCFASYMTLRTGKSSR